MSVGLNTHPLLLVACLLAAGALTYWTYRRTTPRLRPSIKALLGSLRFVALAIVLILLFDPIVTRSSEQERPPVLALLVDNSASLTLADEEALRSQLEAADYGRVGGDVRLYGFDAKVRAGGHPSSGLDSLTFDGGRTNIGHALDQVRQDLREENLQSIVLVSDGLYNSGRNPIYAAEESVVPIHTVVAGDTSRYRDVRVQEVLTNEIAYAGTELPVRIRVLSDGFEGDNVAVSLRSGAQVLGSETIRLSGDGTEQTVDLSVTPGEPGLMQYTATVTQLDGEATHRNNARTVSVQVIDSRRRILLLAGAPDPDVGALRQSLSADASFEIVSHTQQSPQSFYEESLPESLDDVDLVVLSGFPHARSSSEIVARVDALLSGTETPVLFVAGRQQHLEAIRQIGDEVLPAVPTAGASATHEAQVTLTPTGRSHPVMGGHPGGVDAWRSLPPLAFTDAGWEVSPDATVLATVRSRGVDLDDALIVIRSRTGRRSAAVLGSDVWRWRTLPPSLDPAEGLFDRFVENVVQWLTSPEDDRLVRVRPTQSRFEGGEAVRFTGEIYDERLQPVSDADVRITIESPEGDEFPFTMTAEGNGRYRLDAGALPEGSYQFSADATQQGTRLGTDQGAFSVGALELEFQETRADAALMRQIAARTGGQATDLSRLEDLLGDVSSSAGFRPSVERVVRESSLRHTYLLLLLALLFLASEWILRKRSGMV